MTPTIEPISYYKAAFSSPLVEALPKLPIAIDECRKVLEFLPPAPDLKVRAEPPQNRLDYLETLLITHAALNRDREIAHALNSMARNHYISSGSVARHRATAPDRVAELVAAAEGITQSNFSLDGLLRRAHILFEQCETRSLFGVPGSGKSRTLGRIRSYFGDRILLPAHLDPRLPRLIVPILLVEAPSDGTIPSLMDRVILTLEAQIGESLPERLKRAKNRSGLIQAGAEALLYAHVGVIIIDETQKLLRHAGPDAVLLNFILELSNILGIPVLWVGTFGAMNFLSPEMRTARRMLGRPWRNFREDSEDCKTFVNSIWQYQFTAEWTPLSDELRSVIYELTAGLPALIIRLYREVQRVLILSGIAERIDAQILRSTAETLFIQVRPMVNALRQPDSSQLEVYEDLRFDEKAMEDRANLLAEIRRKELEKTIRAAKNSGVRARRRVKRAAALEADAIIGDVSARAGILAAAAAASAAGADLTTSLQNSGHAATYRAS